MSIIFATALATISASSSCEIVIAPAGAVLLKSSTPAREVPVGVAAAALSDFGRLRALRTGDSAAAALSTGGSPALFFPFPLVTGRGKERGGIVSAAVLLALTAFCAVFLLFNRQSEWVTRW